MNVGQINSSTCDAAIQVKVLDAANPPKIGNSWERQEGIFVADHEVISHFFRRSSHVSLIQRGLCCEDDTTLWPFQMLCSVTELGNKCFVWRQQRLKYGETPEQRGTEPEIRGRCLIPWVRGGLPNHHVRESNALMFTFVSFDLDVIDERNCDKCCPTTASAQIYWRHVKKETESLLSRYDIGMLFVLRANLPMKARSAGIYYCEPHCSVRCPRRFCSTDGDHTIDKIIISRILFYLWNSLAISYYSRLRAGLQRAAVVTRKSFH